MLTIMDGKTRQQFGFTLIELIMVVVIIGVLAAVSGPLFFSTGNFDNRFDYESLKAQMRYTQTYAVASGCYAAFEYSGSVSSVKRDADCDKSNGYCLSTDVVDPNTGVAYQVTVESAFAPATLRIVFSPGGEAFIPNSAAACIGDANLLQTPGNNTSFLIGTRTITTEYSTGYIR